MTVVVQILPAALERDMAAAYVGLRLTTFEKAVSERSAPAREATGLRCSGTESLPTSS